MTLSKNRAEQDVEYSILSRVWADITEGREYRVSVRRIGAVCRRKTDGFDVGPAEIERLGERQNSDVIRRRIGARFLRHPEVRVGSG